MYMHITKQTQSNGQSNLTQSRIAALHDHSIVFASWRQCVPSIQNMVRSLSTKLVDGRDSGVETWGSCGSMNRGPELLGAGPGWCHHGLRGSASPVLTATGFVNGRWQFSTPPTESTPLTDHQKIRYR